MQTLLDKTRRMNQLLSMAATEVDFYNSARVICDSIECNVYVLDKMGRVLGYALQDGFECAVMTEDVSPQKEIPASYNGRLHIYRETAANIRQDGTCVFKEGAPCAYDNKVTTILPVLAGGDRLGTLLLARAGRDFDMADLVLAEHAATVVAMEIIRYNQETVEEEARRRTAVQVALGTLSFSE